jgi:hypothetical protein
MDAGVVAAAWRATRAPTALGAIRWMSEQFKLQFALQTPLQFLP